MCVLPIGRIDSAIELALEHGVILCTYADTLRVPASHGLSLFKAKAQGADVRMIYSCDDALRIAQENPEREVVFFAIGFETTTPPTAAVIKHAEALGLTNFSVFCNHVLTPAAMVHIMESENAPEAVSIDGFVGPSHVSTVIGYAAYEAFAAHYHRPVVIAGFEPLDVMQSILMLVRQINSGRAEIENQFTRAVTREGNLKAQALMQQIFELRDSFEWRGLGTVPVSALSIRAEYARFDAERRYSIAYRQVPDHKACECAAILRGHKQPSQCKVFGTACTPDHPIGACMINTRLACALISPFTWP